MTKPEPMKFSKAAHGLMLDHAMYHRGLAAKYYASALRMRGADDESAGNMNELALQNFRFYRAILARLQGVDRSEAQEIEDGWLEKQLDSERTRKRPEEWALR